MRILESFTVVGRSKVRTFLYRSNTGIVGSNSTRGMDICPRDSALSFPVQVEA
jgi:hypothetical protein